MTEHTITLPLRRPPMTANDQRRAHWTTVRKAKADVARLVECHARHQRLPLIDSCRVTVTWFAPTAHRRDCDSLAPMLKASLDALVQAGVLSDDCPPHVLSTAMAVEVDRANPRIEIRIEGTENVES